MSTLKNVDRAHRGEQIVDFYINYLGGDDFKGTALIDILADLMHLAHQLEGCDNVFAGDGTFGEALRIARSHFNAENNGEDE